MFRKSQNILIERSLNLLCVVGNMADNNCTVLDFNAKLSESSEAGETFYKLFYDHLDKKRNVSCFRTLFRIISCFSQLIAHFYADDSLLLWNGNPYMGSSEISSFYQTLPPSEHVLHTVDCQPVPGKYPEHVYEIVYL